MNGAAAEVRIERLRCRGGPAWRDLVLAALDRTDWPQPPADAPLFIRRLHLRSSDWQLPARLRAAVLAALAGARSGWSPRAMQADAVRFDSDADALACLAHDLTRGVAGTRWYWAGHEALSQHPRTRAVGEVLGGHPHKLATVFAILLSRGALPTLIAALDGPTLHQITARLRATLGAAETVATDSSAVATADIPPTDIPPADIPRRAVWRGALALAPPATLRHWQTLATLLLAQEYDPPALRAPARLAAWRRTLDPSPARTTPAPPAAPAAQGAGLPPPRHEAPAQRPPPFAPATTAGEAPQGAMANRGPRPRRSPAPAAADATPAPPVTETFHTVNGGLFYLLNVLRRPVPRGLLGEASGWHWLWWLGQELALAPDPPLMRFLAARLNLEPPERLWTLPAPTGAERMRRHIDREWAGRPVWTPALLARPARVDHTPSHLDVTYPLDSIDLAVRLAGLDQDPGWLPWLGRVVQFHFRETTDAG